MANSIAINVIVAILTFIVALGLDYYIISAFPIFIESMTDDAVLQAICYAGMVILMIAITAIAPYLAIISNTSKPE